MSGSNSRTFHDASPLSNKDQSCPNNVAADENALIEAFLTQAIDANELGFGGWATGGAVEKFGRGSMTEDQRQAVLNWLAARPEITALPATGLIDMWYATSAGEHFAAIKTT